MRLNNRRTVLVGLAFLSICAFWQLYDTVVPLILRDTFHIGDDAAGWVMALDNMLALFLLPFFGRLSDRCDTRIGWRMPFILFGTLLAATWVLVMPLTDRPGRFALFLAVLGLLLLSMGTYRSPAVALMPDVTPRPLRSKANAIINLMGALGGVYTLIAVQFLVFRRADGSANYFYLFLSVAALMLASAGVLYRCVDERRLRAELPPEEEEKARQGRLSGPARGSLIRILLSVFFWYMGYNAVTTAYSKYFTSLWGDLSGAANCLMIATVGAVVSYIPVGMLSSRVGRKRVILAGVCLLAACFGVSARIQTFSPAIYVVFVLVGLAWAAINVNSYPMVVELSRGANTGKYTGYYYAFSMAAQIVTPIVSGWLLENVGYQTLFPYAAAMVGVSFFTMLFVRHGDNRPGKPQSMLEHLGAGD